jgi:hypothetical protein
VWSCEAELRDQCHLRRPGALAAEVDGLPVQAAADLEVPDIFSKPVVEGLRIRHEAGLRSDGRAGLSGLRHVATGGIASEMEKRSSTLQTQSAAVLSHGGVAEPRPRNSKPSTGATATNTSADKTIQRRRKPRNISVLA